VRHLVLGTAGHIDHGKSALVQALTGTDPDRLKEEQERGITIELGFADMELGDSRVLSIVDVPGHERFVRQMVAGATGIDAVLLVVAADQAVQPQTREHLDICELLGIRRGVVALSKCDLVDDELREVVELEVRELLTGTFLEQAPLVPVSARSGTGLDRLRDVLAELFEQIEPRSSAGVARLPVDRAFVLRGFGTVVTGTLVSGRFREGEEVSVLPGARRGRVRGLQTHHQRVEEAIAGRRTAVNLQGLDCADVPRGSSVTRPGELLTTRRLWARLTLLPGAPRSLRKGGPARFHQGTCEREARVRVLAERSVRSLDVEIRLEQETVLAPGDRFILRRPAPLDTVGGGEVLDVDPPPAREATAADFADGVLDPETALQRRLARAGAAGRLPDQLAPELGLTRAQLDAVARTLIESDRLVVAAARWIDDECWSRSKRRVLDELAEFHAAEPLRLGLAREELRARTVPAMQQESWRQLLESLAREGGIRLEGERLALFDHRVELSAGDHRLADRIDAGFRAAGLDPPDLAQLVGADQRRGADQIVQLLIAEGKLERIQDGRLFHAAAMAELRAKLREYARSSKTIDVAAFKQLAGVTRKNAIPLLEQLDAERTTRRMGNLREIL